MNTLVIGGTGFIGYRLVRRLAAAGHNGLQVNYGERAVKEDDLVNPLDQNGRAKVTNE